jgi:hypothetical protein
MKPDAGNIGQDKGIQNPQDESQGGKYNPPHKPGDAALLPQLPRAPDPQPFAVRSGK